METTKDTESTIALFDRKFSPTTGYFSAYSPPWAMVSFAREGQEPACHTCNNLRGDLLFHSCYDGVIAEMQHTPPHCATVLCLHKHSAIIDECQWVPLFPHGGIQWHAFASDALQCQKLLCQTAPVLPSVTRQQHAMENRWEGSASTAVL